MEPRKWQRCGSEINGNISRRNYRISYDFDCFFQWRTAQQKVVIDVFQERYKIYQELGIAVSNYLQMLVFSLEPQRAISRQ